MKFATIPGNLPKNPELVAKQRLATSTNQRPLPPAYVFIMSVEILPDDDEDTMPYIAGKVGEYLKSLDTSSLPSTATEGTDLLIKALQSADNTRHLEIEIPPDPGERYGVKQIFKMCGCGHRYEHDTCMD